MPSQPTHNKEAYFPIRVVSRETGVNAITLRAWERRYGLLTPRRTAKGHRLYSKDDINVIKQVVNLLERGIPVSQARTMIDQPQCATGQQHNLVQESSRWQDYRTQLDQALHIFDEGKLISTFDDVIQFFPLDIVLRYLLIPVYQTLEKQKRNQYGEARLHFYAAFLQARLAWRLYEPTTRVSTHSTSVMITNSRHGDDIYLLLLAIVLKQLGLRPLYFNGNLTARQCIELIQDHHWSAVLLQLPAKQEDIDIKGLTQILAETGRPVFVCGHEDTQQTVLKNLGVMPLGQDIQQSALIMRDMLAGISV